LTTFNKIKSKIVSLPEATEVVEAWKQKGIKTVFTNGCFDLLHLGHLDYLSKSKDLGDKLILGLNSSASVSRLKGPTRPINSTESRAMMLAALEFIDLVVVFEEDTPLNVIASLTPNILVKGGDYTIATIIGASEVEAKGGLVKVIPFLDGYSSTTIVTKIQSLSKN
jgi:rfaE bifunctional protein nucleotidyltransferase chain/domain